MCPLNGSPLWFALCEERHDCRGPTTADLIATRPVDFRCGHQALALMVQTELKLDPHSGITVIFRSKRGDRLKILVWDGSGMVLIYKILEQGSFAWPKVQDGTMRLSRGQYEAMFEGLDWRRVMAQRVSAPSAAG